MGHTTFVQHRVCVKVISVYWGFFLKKGASSHKHLHTYHIWYPKVKQQWSGLHERVKANVCSYSSVCQPSTGSHSVMHDKAVTHVKKRGTFLSSYFFEQKRGSPTSSWTDMSEEYSRLQTASAFPPTSCVVQENPVALPHTSYSLLLRRNGKS